MQEPRLAETSQSNLSPELLSATQALGISRRISAMCVETAQAYFFVWFDATWIVY
jgi:hypothetical protein